MFVFLFYSMDSEMVREAWNECELEWIENLNTFRIDPAVFEPILDGELVFDGRDGDRELWESVKNIENVTFMMEPLDGYLRCSVYVYLDDESNKLSVRTYGDRVKISPADDECSFEAFEYLINEWEANVCELEFLGGLDEMDV